MLNSHTLDTIKERNKKEVTMDYKIKGDSDCPIVEINLQNNETVKIERGSMAYMSNVVIEGKMNSNKKGIGGVLGALGRSITSVKACLLQRLPAQVTMDCLVLHLLFQEKSYV